MPTKTLTLTKTQTVTTTRMLTATLALALANAAALAMVPFEQKAMSQSALRCYASAFHLEQPCGKDTYASAIFRCEGDSRDLQADDGGKCYTAGQWQHKVDGWCQNQCTDSFYHEEEVTEDEILP